MWHVPTQRIDVKTMTIAPSTNPGVVPAETFQLLRTVSTATLTTQLFARGLRNTFIHRSVAMNSACERMVGEAFTLRCIPAREDIDVLSIFNESDHPQRVAIESVSPGEVLVIDSRGQSRAASLGNILATRLLQRGGAGIVTDGSIRDSTEFKLLNLPTFASGPAATTNLAQHHAVDIQVPIGCGEVPVYPGDIMVGDLEGVVCIPRHLVVDVAAAAAKQEHFEKFILQQVESGAALAGVYPPNAQTQKAYHEWSDSTREATSAGTVGDA